MQIIASSFAERPTFVMLQVSVVVDGQVGCRFVFCLYARNSFFGSVLKGLLREEVSNEPYDDLL
jgi:hypothetical protein